jgi:hypothetical protein
MPKKGRHSVGVAPQYASSLGKNAKCQTPVSVTLASREVPVMVGLRLFLQENWTSDPERMAKAKVPADRQGRPDYTGDCHRRDRQGQDGRRALRLRSSRCRIRDERSIPPGAE